MNEHISIAEKELLLSNLTKPDTPNHLLALSKREHKAALDLFLAIDKYSMLTFRGIRKDFMLDRFVLSEASGRSVNDASNLIFYFGDKAKACVADRLKYFPALNTVTLSQLLELTTTTSSVLREMSVESSFISDNQNFYEYFSDTEIFTKLTQSFSLFSKDQVAKLKLRNMLISFLHTAQVPEYKDESALLSTTPKLNETESFAGANDSIVLICWIPHPEERYVIRANPEPGYYECLRKYGLPPLRRGLYDYEHEISFLGAIFPHFIYGYYDKDQNVTVLNPHQFTHKRAFISCVKNGIYIDQTRFKSELKKKTYYKRHAELPPQIGVGSEGVDLLNLK